MLASATLAMKDKVTNVLRRLALPIVMIMVWETVSVILDIISLMEFVSLVKHVNSTVNVILQDSVYASLASLIMESTVDVAQLDNSI